jgi:NTP pyrophosphatase (non-canonical NTP hydrolase)
MMMERNNTMHPLCSELISQVEQGLDPIQQAFDAYQSTCFIPRPPEFFALELSGETGELANLEKKRWRGTPVDEAHVADEAADVLISLMNFCNARGINLAEAVALKLPRIKPSALPEA